MMAPYVAEFQFRYNNRENAATFGTANTMLMLKRLQNAAWIGAFVFLTIGLGNAVWRSSQQAPPPQQAHHTAQDQNKNRAPDQQDKPWKPIGEIWRETRNDPTAFFTFWVAIFTFVLASSTIALWIVTWRSGIRQSKDMLASIEEAKKLANATEHAANAALRQANAMVAMEAPIVIVGQVKLELASEI
jgi:hypothetical protein